MFCDVEGKVLPFLVGMHQKCKAYRRGNNTEENAKDNERLPRKVEKLDICFLNM